MIRESFALGLLGIDDRCAMKRDPPHPGKSDILIRIVWARCGFEVFWEDEGTPTLQSCCSILIQGVTIIRQVVYGEYTEGIASFVVTLGMSAWAWVLLAGI